MNHELIEILKAFVLRDNGDSNIYQLCDYTYECSLRGCLDCECCLLVKGWESTVPFPNMYLEDTLRNLNEPGTIIYIQSII